jgi:hypothetical protein
MTAPRAYDRQYSFSAWQAGHPSDPPPGNELDAEFDAVRASMDETQSALADIRRDDGALGNNTVGYEQLKAEISLGVNPAVPWAPDTQFAVNDMVFNDLKLYRCTVGHTSGDTFDTSKFSDVLADLTSVTLAPGIVTNTALADSAVDERVLADGVVTPGKLGGLPGSSLMGRFSASTGGVQFIVLGDGLSLSDNTLNVTVDGSTIPDGAVGTSELADGAVTLDKAEANFATASLGYTPVNRAGDTGITGVLKRSGAGAHLWHGSSSLGSGKITISSSAPTGGADGDVWFQTA